MKNNGREQDDRIASNNGPSLSHTSLPLSSSVATAVNEIGRSSIWRSPTSLIILSMIFLPLTRPPPTQAMSIILTMSNLVRFRTQSSYSVILPAA